MSVTQNIEYKETWKDEYLKWISGFANAFGGKIYLGISNNGEVLGVSNSKKMMEDIPNKIVNFLGIVADVNLLSVMIRNISRLLSLHQAFRFHLKGLITIVQEARSRS